MMRQIMDLSMTVMTSSNTVVCTGGYNLVIFNFAIGSAGFCVS